MNKYYRVVNIETLEKLKNKTDVEGVILGHENCPHYYNQLNIDKMIETAKEQGFKVKVNIPVLFEEHLEEFKEESVRLLKSYPDVKLVLNDWGILYYLHGLYPDTKFCAGKGISFSYGDNPWNEHILEAEKEEYREALKSSNMENADTIEQLKLLGVDEIEMGDLELSEHAYKHLSEEGFRIAVNKGMSITTMSRACHCLRFLDKVDEMGKCIQYCNKEIIVSIKEYSDMENNASKPISPETKALQPDMFINGNITMVKNKKPANDFSNVDTIIYDERICAVE